MLFYLHRGLVVIAAMWHPWNGAGQNWSHQFHFHLNISEPLQYICVAADTQQCCAQQAARSHYGSTWPLPAAYVASGALQDTIAACQWEYWSDDLDIALRVILKILLSYLTDTAARGLEILWIPVHCMKCYRLLFIKFLCFQTLVWPFWIDFDPALEGVCWLWTSRLIQCEWTWIIATHCPSFTCLQLYLKEAWIDWNRAQSSTLGITWLVAVCSEPSQTQPGRCGTERPDPASPGRGQPSCICCR